MTIAMMKELLCLLFIVLTEGNFTGERSEHSKSPGCSEHSPGNSVVKGFGLVGLSHRAAAETLRWLKTME